MMLAQPAPATNFYINRLVIAYLYLGIAMVW